jgi:hypothetical protein
MLYAHRAAEHAVQAQAKRAQAQLEFDDLQKRQWTVLASLTHDEALQNGCLHENHGPLRMNETLHGDLMNVTLLGKSSHIHLSICILTVLL